MAAAAMLGIICLPACSLLPGSSDEAETADPSKAPLMTLEITGVDGDLADNVHAHVSIPRKPCDISEAYLRVLATRAIEETNNALQAFGYYDASTEVNTDTSDDCPRVHLNVSPGVQTKLDRVDITIAGPGGSDAEFAARIASIGLKRGDPLHHGHYQSAKQTIESAALELGYLEAVFTTRRVEVNPQQHTAAITLSFDSGPRYALGEITINQEPEFVRPELVQRFIDIEAGGAYKADSISTLHGDLSQGSYFGSVDVRPRLSQPLDRTIPVDITLRPRARHAISTGIGVSTDEGIRGRFGYKNRRVNRRGHQLDVAVNASFIEQQWSTSYRLPRRHPVDEWLTFQAGIRHRNVDTFNTIETQLVAAETKRRPWGWMETRFIEFNREDYDVSGTARVSKFLAPGVAWRRTVANDGLFPTRGYDINLELKAAAETILSDTSFVSSVLALGAVYGLPYELRILLRGRLGAMWVEDFDKLPPSERFFAGGDNSIRGYDIDSRGPIDDSGDVVGGTYLGVLSFELEHYFTEQWGVAMFVDSGNAFGGDGRSIGMQTGLGLGARWRSPVGPIRVDIAHPLNDTDNNFRLHLRIGPDL